MLRRVSLNSVTVFLAFSDPRNVTLEVFRRGPDGARSTTVGPASASQPTVCLGKKLHVVAVTASGLSLHPSTLYCYDVTVTKTADSTAGRPGSETLQSFDPEGLSGSEPLGYAIGRLPSFVTPPLQAGNLHFYHGSCRKVHGGGGDALMALDRELEAHGDQPDRRAQMLFLTGDQIYADDVAGPLLPVLTELAFKLLGWHEKVPDAGGATRLAGLPPGSRGRFILRADLTSSAGECHLLGLGEFYAMYLLAWSPALWPTSLPTAADAVPAAALTPANPQNTAESSETAAIREYLAKHPWVAQVRKVMEFRSGLQRARRVLANIPSYMMFDDHEVTDDWYLNAKWQIDILTSPTGIGQRVVGNALAAYAVFQAWGNDPESFGPTSTGSSVLTHLAALGRLEDGDTYRSGQSDHDGLRRALRVVPQSNPAGMLWDYAFKPDDRCEWQVLVLDTRTHRNLTAPGKTDLIDVSDLARQFRARTDNPAPEVTIVVSPAPVIGHPFVEELIDGLITFAGIIDRSPLPSRWRGIKDKAPSILDNENWRNEAAPAAFEQLLLEFSRLGRVVILSGDVHYGFSAAVWYWNRRNGIDSRAAMVQLCSSALRNEEVKTHLVGSLGSQELRTLLEQKLGELSAPIRRRLADTLVTYGWLPVIAPLPLQKPLLKAQRLIATGGTLFEVGVQLAPDALTDRLAPSLAPPGETDYLGWDSIIPRIPSGTKLRQPETRPAIIKLKDTVLPGGLPPPEWSYRVRFCSDLAPDQSLSEPTQFGLETNAQRIKRLKDEMLICAPSNQHRLVVGQSNIGRVRIRRTGQDLRVQHDLERVDGSRYPVTRHFLPLVPPNGSDAEPGRSPLDAAPDLSIWMDLLSFKPDPALGLDLPQIESGIGLLRLDCYGVQVTSAPTRLRGGAVSQPVTLAEFMLSLRRQLLEDGALFDAALGGFSCDPPSDSTRWAGTAAEATGCKLVQHLYSQASLSGTRLDNPVPMIACQVLDSGFVLSAADSNTTVGLAGNRGVFGMQTSTSPDLWLIFTVGAHRSVGPNPLPNLEWARLHRLWSSFPTKLASLISAHGGQASPTRSVQHLVSWSRVAMGWFSPRYPQ